MEMIKIFGIGITGAVLALLLKEYKPVLSASLGLITALGIFLILLSEIGYVFDAIAMLSDRIAIETEYIRIIIRIIGIAYLSGLGGDLCRDAGQNAIGKNIELAGKMIIVVESLPVITAVLNLLIGILPAV